MTRTLTRKQKAKAYRQNYRVKKLTELTGKTTCQICGKKLKPGLRFVVHHLSYKGESGGEKVTLLCAGCHTWLHGMGIVYHHTFKNLLSRSRAPLLFAQKVMEMYSANL